MYKIEINKERVLIIDKNGLDFQDNISNALKNGEIKRGYKVYTLNDGEKKEIIKKLFENFLEMHKVAESYEKNFYNANGDDYSVNTVEKMQDVEHWEQWIQNAFSWDLCDYESKEKWALIDLLWQKVCDKVSRRRMVLISSNGVEVAKTTICGSKKKIKDYYESNKQKYSVKFLK